MKFFRHVWFWLCRHDLENDFDEEVRQHLDLKVQENIARGMSREEALRRARADFGNPVLAKEHTRQSWGFPVLEALWQDIRYAFRQLRKSPGFAAIAVITLALGIGANTAIFSAVYAVLLKPLPFRNADRLVVLKKQNRARGWTGNNISAAEFLAWRDQTHAFEDMAAYTQSTCTLNTGEEAEEDQCEVTASNLFSLLGVRPMRGRTFSREEDGRGAPPVAILSYELWQRRFGGDEATVGRSVRLNGASVTVVGVMPPNFSHLYSSIYSPIPDIWLSGIALAPDSTWNDYFGIGRLRPGNTIAQAQAEMDAISQRVEQTLPDLKGWRAQPATIRSMVSADTGSVLVILMGAVIFVLLIACANVANLLLARGAGRAGEFGVRQALGASHWRLVRQLLTESLLISMTGGALGIALAWWGSKGLAALAPPILLRTAPGLGSTMEWRVLAFALAIALATTFLFGLVPAVQSARSGIAETMKETGRSALETRRSRRFRAGLVISEIALALVLLAGAGLMVRTLAQLSRTNRGFDATNILTLRVTLSGDRYKGAQAIADFWHRVTAGVESLPGVESASVTRGLPVDDWAGQSFTTAEHPEPPAGQVPDANYIIVGPDYFRTLHIPLLKGRAFTEQDREGARRVVIVNEELARTYWPDQNPLGKQLRLGAPADKMPWLSVVGVAGNVLSQGPDRGFLSELYVPYEQYPWIMNFRRLELVVRTVAGVRPESVAHAVVEEIHGVDREQPAANLRTLEDVESETSAVERMVMALLGGFAGLALVLAVMGIYSVLSYTVAQRTREIGVRVALGAQQADVLRLIVGGGARLAIAGIAAGVIAGLMLTRLMAELLYGVRATDPLTFCVVAVMLALASLIACYVPASRAARVDPMVALRHE